MTDIAATTRAESPGKQQPAIRRRPRFGTGSLFFVTTLVGLLLTLFPANPPLAILLCAMSAIALARAFLSPRSTDEPLPAADMFERYLTSLLGIFAAGTLSAMLTLPLTLVFLVPVFASPVLPGRAILVSLIFLLPLTGLTIFVACLRAAWRRYPLS